MSETSTPKSQTAKTESTDTPRPAALQLTELDKFRIQQDAIRARSGRRLF